MVCLGDRVGGGAHQVLSPSAILDRLQSRLQLLIGGALDLPNGNRHSATPLIGATAPE